MYTALNNCFGSNTLTKIHSSSNFNKRNECTIVGGKYVIKYRNSGLGDFVNRGEVLRNELQKSQTNLRVPDRLTSLSENIAYYVKVPGETLTTAVLKDETIFDQFLNQCRGFLLPKQPPDYDTIIGSFKTRVLYRIGAFLNENPEFDSQISSVNGSYIPTTLSEITHLVETAANRLYFAGLHSSLCHGDLTLDNIVYSDAQTFYIIDWRPEFKSASGKISYTTSPYYDLGKLYAFFYYDFWALRFGEHQIEYDARELHIQKAHSRFDTLLLCYESWIKENGYDLNLIHLAASLHLLAMSGLHSKYHAAFCYFGGLDHLVRHI